MKQQRKKFWTAKRLALTLLTFACAALAVSSCKSDDTANLKAGDGASKQPTVSITTKSGAPPAPNAAAVNMLAPEIMDAEIEPLDGKAFRLSDFKDKVIVLDLWATWCGPCRLEIPHLVDVSNEYGSKGVEVIGLTTENPETDSETVRDFAKQFNIGYRLGFARRELALGLMRGNASIPQTFVIAPGGRVVAHYRGFSPQIPTMLRAAIDKATDKSSGD
jgi:thiol-disulfide isomerase/thioredoxin